MQFYYQYEIVKTRIQLCKASRRLSLQKKTAKYPVISKKLYIKITFHKNVLASIFHLPNQVYMPYDPAKPLVSLHRNWLGLSCN